MREIKFRAWDKELKRMWNYADDGNEVGFCLNTTDSTLELIDLDSEYREIIECEFMQYIGKDKNGKEIYEGDIVKFLDTGEEGYEYKEGYEFENTASVVWENGRFKLENFRDNNSAVLEYMNNESHEEFINELMNDCEVIGNIYENKELLNDYN